MVQLSLRLDKRGLKRPEFAIVAPEARVPRDGAPGLEAALARLWGDDLPIPACTVHSEGGNHWFECRPNRNLLAHAPKHCTRRSAPIIAT